jgi:uncharacterized membrane protein
VRVDAPAAVSRAARLPLIDAARGLALLAMAVYHFSWDIRYFGYISADVTGDLGWRIFARLIAGSFLFLVGVSLVLATRNGLNWTHYFRRLGMIVAAAAAITVVTYFVFPNSYIFFGILHDIAVASVLGLAFVHAPVLVVAAGAVGCFLAPPLLSGPFFDHPALVWLGLSTYRPHTNDFVPIFPWFGVVLAGIAAARLAPLVRWQRLSRFRLGENVPWPLTWAGRHSLAVYLLHQPALFGLVFLAAQVSPPSLLAFEESFIENCSMPCIESELEPDICRRACSCIAKRTQAEGLWTRMMRGELTPTQETQYYALADQCRAEAER